MSRPKQPQRPQISEAEQYARDAVAFLSTPFGQQFVQQLNVLYNNHHQRAETPLTAEQKAFAVERAAGIKEVMTDLLSQQGLLDGGAFAEPQEPPANT